MSGVRSFLSTPSMRRATGGPQRPRGNSRISIHALREEGDPAPYPLKILNTQFLSTPSARRATKDALDKLEKHLFLSTPSARRATDVAAAGHDLDAISIHALREEGDREPTPRTEAMQFLSTPSARRATPPARKRAPQKKFLSTPSARRATSLRWTPDCRDQNFYPRPPRGGRH